MFNSSQSLRKYLKLFLPGFVYFLENFENMTTNARTDFLAIFIVGLSMLGWAAIYRAAWFPRAAQGAL